MERYHPRGLHFCRQVQSQVAVNKSLRQVAQSASVATLFSALNPCQLFLVGGTVRDLFFGDAATDLDLATNLSAREIRERCLARGLRVVDTGIQHGTVLVVIDGTHHEVTTFRKPSDRNTQIDASDIATDLSGRDFTINAIAFCVGTLTLVDPLGGIHDLASGLLRAVGDPAARLSEDPLRILRMVRFGDAQGRTIDKATESSACALVSRLAAVSVERIRHELDQILLSPCPAAGIRKLFEIGALPCTIPELLPAVGFEQNRYHLHDVFDHTLSVIDRTPTDRILRWAAVFHDIGKPHTLSTGADGERHFYSHEVVSTSLGVERMKQLKFSGDDIKKISSIVRHHMRPMNCGPAGVRRLIRDLGDELPLWRSFKDADSSPTIAGDEISATAAYFDSLLETETKKLAVPAYGRLAINGEDLKAIGIQAGPEMGKILRQLQDLILEDPTRNSKETLFDLVRTMDKCPKS